jgi:hypothetical protein
MNIFSWLKNLNKQNGSKDDYAKFSSTNTTVDVQAIGFEVVGPTTQNKTQNFYDEFLKIKKEVEKSKGDLQTAVKKIEYIDHLTHYGFVALILVVAGLVFGYWQFVFDSVRKDDYKYGFTEKINSQNQEIINLQEDRGKLLGINNCLKSKRYWQYESCFK